MQSDKLGSAEKLTCGCATHIADNTREFDVPDFKYFMDSILLRNNL
jgi:hypothetical protein